MDDHVLDEAKRRVGKVLNGKWTLDRLIGVGAMAAVYEATHRNRKKGAIKILHKAAAANKNVKTRFLREGYAANTVDHEGVVTVDDDDIAEDGSPYLVMELLRGETVDSRAHRKGGKLPVSDVLSIANQVLEVLSAAHAKGVVHRDLKPENLFLTKGGKLKILDFGIARLHELAESGESSTRVGALLGTPAYMPPEQAKGKWSEVDARSDIWALGAIMFMLITGRTVHEGETANELLAHTVTRPPRSIAEVQPSLQPGLVELIDTALAFDKNDRWQSPGLMQEALRRAYASSDSLVRRSVMPSIVDNAAVGGPRTLRKGESFTDPDEATAVMMGSQFDSASDTSTGRLRALASGDDALRFDEGDSGRFKLLTGAEGTLTTARGLSSTNAPERSSRLPYVVAGAIAIAALAGIAAAAVLSEPERAPAPAGQPLPSAAVRDAG